MGEPVALTRPTPMPQKKKKLPSNQAAPLMQALVRFGPVPVSVDAGSWHLYKGGVWDKCNEKEPTLDHAVNLVG